MAFRRAFTLIELLVVISIIAILIGILLPVLSTVQKVTWHSSNAANQTQILQSLNLFAADHDGDYPTDDLPDVNSTTHDYSFSSSVSSARGRMTNLIDNKYIEPSLLVNPKDRAVSAHDLSATPVGPQTPINKKTNSYALLELNREGSANPATDDFDHPDWREDGSPKVGLVFDRWGFEQSPQGNIDKGWDNASVWNRDGPWEGNIGWGDGGVTWENDPVVETRVKGNTIANDNIMQSSEGGSGPQDDVSTKPVDAGT